MYTYVHLANPDRANKMYKKYFPILDFILFAKLCPVSCVALIPIPVCHKQLKTISFSALIWTTGDTRRSIFKFAFPGKFLQTNRNVRDYDF